MMEVTVITEEPSVDAFTSRAEYEAQTPTIFQQFDTGANRKPVLFNHVPHAELMILDVDLQLEPLIAGLQTDDTEAQASDGAAQPTEPSRATAFIPVSLWIDSDYLTIVSARKPYGIQIPYEFVSHHGYHVVQISDRPAAEGTLNRYAVLIEMTTRDRSHDMDDDDDEPWPSFSIIPTEDNSEATVKSLYEGIAKCMDLHPDPKSPEDGNASALPDFGSGTWITAENVDEYSEQIVDDAEGLGPGAGTVRSRDAIEDSTNGVELNGHHNELESEEETKWRRTG